MNSYITKFFAITNLIIVLYGCQETSSNKSTSKPIQVQYEPVIYARPIELPTDAGLYGKLSIKGTKIKSLVGGEIETGEVLLQIGQVFKKGDLLFQINNKEAYQKLMKHKKYLIQQLEEIVSIINQEDRNDGEQLIEYINQIKTEFKTSDLPSFTSNTKELIEKKKISTQLQKVQQLEKDMENYFVLAPFDGQILQVNYMPGQSILSNKEVLIIGKKRNYQIEMKNGPSGKNVKIFDLDGICIGQANELNLKTEDAIKHYDFTPNNRFNGQLQMIQLKAKHSPKKTAYWLPNTAINKNSVAILKDNNVIHQKIEILEEDNNGCFIIGINENELILVNYK